MVTTAPGDPSLLYPRNRLEAGEEYSVVSAISDVDDESLRQASDVYPSWVVPRYLQVPEELYDKVARKDSPQAEQVGDNRV